MNRKALISVPLSLSLRSPFSSSSSPHQHGHVRIHRPRSAITRKNSPSLQRRSGRLPRVLVLAPTRELAKQVEKEIKESTPYLSTVCVYGGVSYNLQQNALSRGVDVVMGTLGWIIELINNNNLQLSEVQYLVLNEADQMLAVGFEEDVEVILERLPAKRQSMLFFCNNAWLGEEIGTEIS